VQQTELSRVDPGAPELPVKELGRGPGGPAEASAGAGQEGQSVLCGASVSHAGDNMYLHVTVKDPESSRSDLGEPAAA
jgi:hypothetical protein